VGRSKRLLYGDADAVANLQQNSNQGGAPGGWDRQSKSPSIAKYRPSIRRLGASKPIITDRMQARGKVPPVLTGYSGIPPFNPTKEDMNHGSGLQ